MTFLDQRIIIKVIHSIQQEHLLNTQPERKKKEKRNEKKNREFRGNRTQSYEEHVSDEWHYDRNRSDYRKAWKR